MNAAAFAEAKPPPPFVFQRQDGAGDCVVAAYASATGLDYDTIAEALSYDPNRNDGIGGVTALEVVEPLLRLGFATVILAVHDGHEAVAGHRLPRIAELRRWLKGRSAVLYIREPEVDHAVAWRDGLIFDGRCGLIVNPLEQLPLMAASLVIPLERLDG